MSSTKKIDLFSHWLPQIHPRGTNPAGEECRAVGTLELCCGKGPPDRCRWDLGLFFAEKTWRRWPSKLGDFTKIGTVGWKNGMFFGPSKIGCFSCGTSDFTSKKWKPVCKSWWFDIKNSKNCVVFSLGISPTIRLEKQRWKSLGFKHQKLQQSLGI